MITAWKQSGGYFEKLLLITVGFIKIVAVVCGCATIIVSIVCPTISQYSLLLVNIAFVVKHLSVNVFCSSPTWKFGFSGQKTLCGNCHLEIWTLVSLV